jgi:hypothetical protein
LRREPGYTSHEMVLAHAGGIDEILLIVLPLVVFTLTYRLARGRVPDPRKQDVRT